MTKCSILQARHFWICLVTRENKSQTGKQHKMQNIATMTLTQTSHSMHKHSSQSVSLATFQQSLSFYTFCYQNKIPLSGIFRSSSDNVLSSKCTWMHMISYWQHRVSVRLMSTLTIVTPLNSSGNKTKSTEWPGHQCIFHPNSEACCILSSMARAENKTIACRQVAANSAINLSAQDVTLIVFRRQWTPPGTKQAWPASWGY